MIRNKKRANPPEKWQELAKKLNFNKKNQALLLQALTHPAYFEGVKAQGEEDNQRLEFLGDAVLDLVVGYYLYTHYPQAQEGELTKMRAATVCEAYLGKMAEELGINEALRLGKGSEAGGDRSRPSVLADALEAVIGAIFVTQGLEGATTFVEKYFGEDLQHLSREDYEDKKSLLQELVQKRDNGNVSYRLLHTSGPDHAKVFVSGAYWHKILLAEGEGNSKKESEQEAAKAALGNREAWLPKLNKQGANKQIAEKQEPASKEPEKKAPERKGKEKKAAEQNAPKQKTTEKKTTEKKVPKQKAPEKKAAEEKAPKKRGTEKKAPAQAPSRSRQRTKKRPALQQEGEVSSPAQGKNPPTAEKNQPSKGQQGGGMRGRSKGKARGKARGTNPQAKAQTRGQAKVQPKPQPKPQPKSQPQP